MAFLTLTSPHAQGGNQTQTVMQTVLLATIPGLLTLTWYFGWGTLVNVIIASLTAIAAESFVLHLRKRPIMFSIRDCSALVTAVLLGLAIPPTAPWWLTILGTAFAITIAKQLYGGLGNNPFNPAMVGYVLLLISFPKEMTAWIPTSSPLSFIDALTANFAGSVGGQTVDAITMATPLDTLKTAARDHDSLATIVLQYEVLQTNALTGLFGPGWLGANIAFLIGGLYLLHKKVINWHIPVAMLAALGIMATVFYLVDERYGSPLFHLLSGGTMLGAFFIATDPVSAATSNKGRLVFGAGIGITVYVIRAWGGYPDAIAFAVLLMNLSAPTIDYYTQPRSYGHDEPKRGTVKTGA